MAKSKIKHLKGNDEQPDTGRRICISGKPRGPIPTAPYSQLATTTHLDAQKLKRWHIQYIVPATIRYGISLRIAPQTNATHE